MLDIEEIEAFRGRLIKEFVRMNTELFGNAIPEYEIRVSRRSYRTHGSINFARKTIRISLPLFIQHGWRQARQTLLHEMTHAYIHEQGGRTGHTKRFWREYERRGGVREKVYVEPENHYVYACPTCGTEIKRVRRIRRPWTYSCLKCDSRYNPIHRLYLKRDKGQSALKA